MAGVWQSTRTLKRELAKNKRNTKFFIEKITEKQTTEYKAIMDELKKLKHQTAIQQSRNEDYQTKQLKEIENLGVLLQQLVNNVNSLEKSQGEQHSNIDNKISSAIKQFDRVSESMA